MFIHKFIAAVSIIIMLAVVATGIYILVLVIKALKKYIGSKEVRKEIPSNSSFCLLAD